MSQLTVLTVSGSPTDVGTSHGETFAEDIKTYLASRVALSRQGTALADDQIIALAERMLPAHRAYDPDLYDEMCAMADAAGISPAEAVIVGGYTDFIDTVRAVARGTAMEDTCTAVITPDESSEGQGFLAQTWDMNSSATPHVFMLDVARDGAPRAMVFTTHGCLGQIGMNEAGIGIGINNLTVLDGAIGVTWPMVVRKVLKQTTFDDALACITDADLAGGHNFLLVDAEGNGASIEATATRTAVDRMEAEPLVHTNHCLFPSVMEVEEERPIDLDENSKRRLKDAISLVAGSQEHTLTSLMAMLRDEDSICRHPDPPYSYESSGAVIMRPKSRELWACWGIPSQNEFESFTI